MKYIVVLIVFILSLHANWKSDRENLQHVYILDEFRLFYSLHGQHAIQDKHDSNQNAIPDIVENVALQLSVSNQVFQELVGLKSPLQQQRYKEKNVQFIDVHFLEVKGHGSSGDAAILYDYKVIKNSAPSLSIAISNSIKVGNLTPEHELFHAYQNGYTLFKNRWYTEGTARWSEFLFKEGTGKQNKLPSTAKQIHEILGKTYAAKYFWNRLLRVCTKNNKDFTVPNNLGHKKYINSTLNVIEGNDIYGLDFIKRFFENVDFYDDMASKQRGLSPLSWKESIQKDFSNNLYLLLAIKKTIKEINPKYTNELNAFLKALDDYLLFFKNNEMIVDLTKFISTLGTAYVDSYPNNTEHIYSRNIWDMKLFNNRLYLGAGNSSNSAPSKNAGPIVLQSYDLKMQQFVNETTIDDEEISLFRKLNNKLFIPGIDAVENHNYGNFYKLDDAKWKKFRTIPNALHVYDITYFDNKLFVAFSNNNGAAVAMSSNNGKEWKVIELGQFQRAFSLLKANGKLYVIKQLWDSEKQKKMALKTKENYFFVAEYKDGTFIPRYDLGQKDLFPYSNIKSNRTMRISKSEFLGKVSVYLGVYYFDNPFAFFITSSLDEKSVNTRVIKLPEILQPVDLIVQDTIYLLASKKDYKSYENIVYKLSNLNAKPQALFRFTTKTIVRSFELSHNTFYFGLGSVVKSKKKWKQEELHPDSGKIIKIEYIQDQKKRVL